MAPDGSRGWREKKEKREKKTLTAKLGLRRQQGLEEPEGEEGEEDTHPKFWPQTAAGVGRV